MSKTPNYDAKVKAILDATRAGERTCALTGEKWDMTDEEIGWYKKFNVPPMKYSPNTTWKWYACFDAGYQFWWTPHAMTGKPVLTYVHPASGHKVLPDKEWHAQDFSSVIQPYDPARSFFKQIDALAHRVPMLASGNMIETEHSLSIWSGGERNCYFNAFCRGSDTIYSIGCLDIDHSSLCVFGVAASKCHAIHHSTRMHNCRFTTDCLDCMDSAFLFDCRNCEFCFGAVNKRNKKYLWWNEQLTKEEWEKRRGAIDFGRRDVTEHWQKEFKQLLEREAIWPENFNVGGDASSGDYLTKATRCTGCFAFSDPSTDSFRTVWSWGGTTGTAFQYGDWGNTDCYCNGAAFNSSKIKFCLNSERLDQCEYCISCYDCVNCFGCVGLKKKSFCIFNNQYSEEEYWQRVDELKCAMLERGEYGQIFPVSMGYSYVPENGAAIYCGSSLEELSLFQGKEFEPTAAGAMGEARIDSSKVRQASDIPNSIDDFSDDWLGVPIYDPVAKRHFTFIKPEVDHYREMRIAPPITHFVRRVNNECLEEQVACFEHRSCTKCDKEILTSKNVHYPNRRIFCNVCYLKHVEATN